MKVSIIDLLLFHIIGISLIDRVARLIISQRVHKLVKDSNLYGWLLSNPSSYHLKDWSILSKLICVFILIIVSRARLLTKPLSSCL